MNVARVERARRRRLLPAVLVGAFLAQGNESLQAAPRPSSSAFDPRGVVTACVGPRSDAGPVLALRVLSAGRTVGPGLTTDVYHELPVLRQDDPIAVSLTEATAPPDGRVVLPVSLSAPEDAAVGAIDLRLSLPAASMSFVTVEPSGLAVAVSASARSEVKDTTGGIQVVEAHISTVEPGGTRQALPSGPVAYLTFKIDAGATPGDAIDVPLQVSVRTTDDPPRVIALVGTANGRVTVADSPVPMCFFYMH